MFKHFYSVRGGGGGDPTLLYVVPSQKKTMLDTWSHTLFRVWPEHKHSDHINVIIHPSIFNTVFPIQACRVMPT